MSSTTRQPRRAHRSRRMATVAAIAVAASSVLVPANPAEAVSPCRAWAFIGIPGTNQGKAHKSGISDTALYGPQIAMVKQEFVKRKGASNVALYPINYPAKFGFLMTGYSGSVNSGVSTTKTLISKVAKSCPNTKFVIAGYSQGAHVGTLVLGALPVATSKVHRGAFMGNPLYRDGSTNSVEVPARSVTRSGILNGGRNWQTRWNGKVRDVCINSDLVCEGASTTSTAGHGAYTTKNYPGQSKKIAAYLGYNWLGG